MSSKEYAVKYLGIVEGSVGCLSRKMPLPVCRADRQLLTGVAGNNLKDFKFNGALIRAPVLRNKYKTVAQPNTKNSKALDELTLNEDVDDSPLKEGFVTQVDFPTNTNQ